MRPSRDQYFMDMARHVATRSTCARRSVGCVVVDFMGRVLSTGYNGVPPGYQHCTDVPCAGANLPSGTGLDICQATHAEINALLFCSDIRKIHAVYITTAPCMSCIKAIMASSCSDIIFGEPYSDEHYEQVKKLLSGSDILLRQIVPVQKMTSDVHP